MKSRILRGVWSLSVHGLNFFSAYFGWFLAVSNEESDNRSLEEILGSISPPPPPAMTNEAGAPRLMITHIVNQNFKSYAGEQTLGPFHKVIIFSLKHSLNEGKVRLCCVLVALPVVSHNLTSEKQKNIEVLELLW